MSDEEEPTFTRPPDTGIDSMIWITLSDAATNCARDGATAVLTLRSGVQFEGKLKKAPAAFPTTAHMEHDDGGWTTLLVAELVAVTTKKAKERHRGF